MNPDISTIYTAIISNTDQKSESDLINGLYKCYTQENHNSKSKKYSTVECEDFLNNLNSIFANTNTKHYNWQIIEMPSKIECIISKKKRERRIKVSNIDSRHHVKLGNIVNFHLSAIFQEEDPYFFHLRGKTIEGDSDHAALRYYFNLNPNFVSNFLKYLYDSLNKYQIPFHFKCIANPNHYNRKDNGVLFVSRTYFHIVNTILKRDYSKLKPYLNPDKVLFSKKIASGISYAESPENNESYGYIRCRDIARVYFSLKEPTLKNLKDGLKSLGYDLNNFHRNPHSQFISLYESK